MEHTSAHGTAGSVVGIASFGFQLSQRLYPFTKQTLGAKESLHNILHAIEATTCALEQVHTFLAEECKRLEERGHASLFSKKGIKDVKGTADKCLIIFWRIEAAITNKSGSKFESTLIERLELFNAESCKEQRQPVAPDPELTRLEKREEARVKLSTWRRLRWPYIAPKLDQFNNQLQLLQTNLVLIFQVISLGARSRRPNQRGQDVKVLLDMYSGIQRMAYAADISQLRPRLSYGANEQLANFERPENPLPELDNLHPFMLQDLFRRPTLPPRRRQLSPVFWSATHNSGIQHKLEAHLGDDSSDEYGFGHNAIGDPFLGTADETMPLHWPKPIKQRPGLSSGPGENLPDDTRLTNNFGQARDTKRSDFVGTDMTLALKDEHCVGTKTQFIAISNLKTGRIVAKDADTVPSTNQGTASDIITLEQTGNAMEPSRDDDRLQGSNHNNPSTKPLTMAIPTIIEQRPIPTSNTGSALIWYNDSSDEASETAVNRSAHYQSDTLDFDAQVYGQHGQPMGTQPLPSGRKQLPPNQENSGVLDELPESFQAITRDRITRSPESGRNFYNSVPQISKSSGHRRESKGLLSRMKTLFHFEISSKRKTSSMVEQISSIFNKKMEARKDDSSTTSDSNSDYNSRFENPCSSSGSGKIPSWRIRSSGSDRRSESSRSSAYRSLSLRPPRHSYLLESGLARSGAIDPIMSAYQAGREHAMAEWYENSYSSRFPPGSHGLARNNEIVGISQMDHYNLSRLGFDRRIPGQYGLFNDYNDRPPLPRCYPAPGSSYVAYDPIYKSQQTYSLHQRLENSSDAEIIGHRGTQFQNRSSEHSWPPGIDSYPRHYDSKPFDPRLSRERDEGTDGDGNDIVQQLLLEWTPQQANEDEAKEINSRQVGAGQSSDGKSSKHKGKEAMVDQSDMLPVEEASQESKIRSRQTTVDDVVDELDERPQSPFSVVSVYGSDTWKKDKTLAEPEPATGSGSTTAMSAIINARREMSPPPISQPQPQPQSQPSWLGSSWAQKVVETTTEKRIGLGQSSRTPLQHTFEPRSEADIRYRPSPSTRATVPDYYPNSAEGPADYTYRDELYQERGRLFEPDYRQESPFGSRDRHRSPRNAGHPFAPPQGGLPPSLNFDNGW